MPKVLLTGGAGFIGSHIADLLLAEGWRVAIVDDLSSGKPENVPAGAAFHQTDIRDAELDRVVAAERPDFVVHEAAQMSVVRSVADPAFDASVNIHGLLNLLSAAVKHGVRKVVFASTGGALYGEPDPSSLPCPETTPVLPLSPYGITKMASEHYLRFFEMAHGLPYVALRYGNVYGPRQDPHGEAGVVAIFCRAMREGRPVKLFGRGEPTRDYVHVADVARANLLALQSDLRSGSLNIGTAVETPTRRIFEVLAAWYHYDLPPEELPMRPGEVHRIALDYHAARAALGWEPRVGLEEGLAETAGWFAGS